MSENSPKARSRLAGLAQTLARTCAALTLTLVLAACGSFGFGPTITGSGNTVTKQFALTNFSGVSAGSTFQVSVSPGPSPSVAVTVDDNLAPYLDVTVSGARLHLDLKPNVNLRNATLKAVVTVPELTALELSGASKGVLEDCRAGKSIDIEVSGASRLEGTLESHDTRLSLSGASHADLKGTAGDLRVNVSGASHLDLGQFLTKDSVVEASGASHALVNPSGKLKARASGASSIRYAGQPTTVDSESSGASSVKAR